MSMSRWLMLIGVVVALGLLRVAQRTGLLLQGYATGTLLHDVHREETEVAWLTTQVQGLSSPMHLASAAADQHRALVAWALLPSASQPPSQMDQVAAMPPDDVTAERAPSQ